ncbi:MAG: hypothetical protein IT336_13830, partial [Thermomicrobiales bacterium]|nr:hypothetical protein [Thermomicrobiales bacterium]
FPWRLSDAVSRMMGGRRRSTAPPSLHLADHSHDADQALALLEAVASDLPDRLGRILICRIRDGMTWPEIAVEVGVDRRTVLRDWRTLRLMLRASLTGAD